MANLFLNTSWISMEVLRNLKNALKVAEYFNHDWEKDYEKAWAVGTTIQVKFPQQFTIRNGLGYDPQGINRISTTISLDEPFGIDFQWDDYEAAVKAERSEEEIREQYLAPVGVQLANEWDSRAALFAKNNTSQIVGSLGTDPTSIVFLDQARARLLQKAGSYLSKKRAALISSSMQTNSINTPVTSLFQPTDAITEAFKEGSMGKLKTFDVFEEQNLYSHTAGTWAAAVTISGAGQSGTSLNIIDSVGDTFNVGDKFGIANVNLVNPRSRRPPGPLTLQTFTVTVALVGTGADVLNFLPAIYGPAKRTAQPVPECGRSAAQRRRAHALPWHAQPERSHRHGRTGDHSYGLRHRRHALLSAESGGSPFAGRRQGHRHPGAFRQSLGRLPLVADQPLRHRGRLRQPVSR